MPPKRKRAEPKLEDRLSEWEQKLARGLKMAKGLERQRLSKRVREAPDKAERFEREIAVLKSLDLHQAARAHLCSSLLKIKGVAESPNLPEFIRPVAKPNLAEEERVALHNVTSALCNRKQVREVVEECVKGVCEELRVPLPGKAGKGKKADKEGKEGQADDIHKKTERHKEDGKGKGKNETMAKPTPGKIKLEEGDPGDESEESWGGIDDNDLSGSEAEEKSFSRYARLLGNSSDEDSDGDSEDDLQDSRIRAIHQTKAEDWSGGSSAEESEADSEEDSHSKDESNRSSASPPPKKTKLKVVKPVSVNTSTSAFLPSLMGGYISDSQSEASDLDVAPARKNRRGQRARQAIWEKKFGEQAKHKINPKDDRSQGWDLRKGAVGEDIGPWKRGIGNPLRRSGRQQIESGPCKPDLTSSNAVAVGPGRGAVEALEKPKPKPIEEGPLHPSWEAARKAKEANQKVAFAGKKITFD